MNMIELICRVLVKEHGLTEHSLPKSFQNLKDIAKKEKFIPDVDQVNTKELLDGLMLLANGKTFLRKMDDMRIYELFERLKISYEMGEMGGLLTWFLILLYIFHGCFNN